MKPSKLNLTRFGSLTATRSLRVLSVLSAAILFTGCYTKLATDDGDHWGYTGPVKKKVVVRETEDTIVVKETRVIRQPQPVITDTLTYSNTSTGEENVVVNNYYAPAPATFGAYDPWSNSYPTWYDHYWNQPRASVVISIGDPYHHHHSPWFNRHWRRHAYYQSYWDYNYYNLWDNWYHTSYRGPGWAYYDPYYPYPPMYNYGYGCYSPLYDPFYYGHGGYYGGHYGHGYGHGHYGYYGDNDHDDGRDENGRKRRRGNVGGEERGRGGVTSDGGNSNTGVTRPRDGSSPIGLPQADRVKAVPVSGGASHNPANAGASRASKGGFNSGSGQNTTTGTRVGTVDISTGDIPVDAASDPGFGRTTNIREVKSSPSQGAPGVYQGSVTPGTATTTRTNPSPTQVERRPEAQPTTTRTSSTPTNVVKSTGTKAATTGTSTSSTSASTTKSSTSVSSAPEKSTRTQAPTYTPRSSGSSNSGSTSSSVGRSSASGGSSSSSSSSSRGSDSRSSDSRSSDSRSSDSRSDEGGGRGRR